MPVDSCKSCKKPQWSTSEGRFLLASLLGPLCLTGVSTRLSHPTDNAKIAVHLMLFRLLRETFVWVWLAPLSVCLHRKTSIKVGGDKIPPSFDLVLVVLKSACFFPFSELWNHWHIINTRANRPFEFLRGAVRGNIRISSLDSRILLLLFTVCALDEKPYWMFRDHWGRHYTKKDITRSKKCKNKQTKHLLSQQVMKSEITAKRVTQVRGCILTLYYFPVILDTRDLFINLDRPWCIIMQ